MMMLMISPSFSDELLKRTHCLVRREMLMSHFQVLSVVCANTTAHCRCLASSRFTSSGGNGEVEVQNTASG